jgi:hypothetical protein
MQRSAEAARIVYVIVFLALTLATGAAAIYDVLPRLGWLVWIAFAASVALLIVSLLTLIGRRYEATYNKEIAERFRAITEERQGPRVQDEDGESA